MEKYTTGELAGLCGVSVRTVQYYDSRGILKPSALSEGGRRLYAQKDLKRMRVICFLRGLGLSINSIAGLLEEDDPAGVITVLLERRESELREELSQRQGMLDDIAELKRELKGVDELSVETIGDIAYKMENSRKLKRLHMIMLLTGIPVFMLEWAAIVLWAAAGLWQLFAVYMAAAAILGTGISLYYFRRVAYICPQCHSVFRPRFKEAFFARHTPTLRKLTCSCCGYNGFCVETYGKGETINAENNRP